VDKININLLPKEVLDKRKSEGQLALILLAGIAIAFLLTGGYGYNYFRIATERSRLSVVQEENRAYEREIGKVADFEQAKLSVDARENLVKTAVSEKYSWSKMLNNISLVVSNEVWLTDLQVKAGGEVVFKGMALPESGQKAIAKWLVHLAEMRDVEEVWLTSSKKTELRGVTAEIGPTAPGTPGQLEPRNIMEFQTTLKVKSLQADRADGPNVPAPPKPGEKT
jgi:Tfp pilus assembly protein PilN